MGRFPGVARSVPDGPPRNTGLISVVLSGHFRHFVLMNTIRLLATLASVCLALSVAGGAQIPAASNQSGRTQPFILGADITFLLEDEAASLISTPHL